MFGPGASTVYEDPDVKLALPPGWVKLQSSRTDLVTFRDAAGQRQLSLSVLKIADPPQTAAQLHEIVKSLYHVRLTSERQHLTGDDPIRENGCPMLHNVPLGIISGLQRSAGRLFSAYVTGKKATAVVLYLESLSGDPRMHLELANELFRGMTIK